jgi:trimeric autotransporter adhesin
VSTSGITSSLLSQIANSPSSLNQFVTDFNQLSGDLKSGNMSAAQDDYVTLSQDALNGVTSSTATSSSSGLTASLLTDVASSPGSSTTFSNELSQLGSDLANNNLTSSQEDLLNLDSTTLNAASPAGASSAPTSMASTATNQAEMKEMVQSVIQAMEFGDSSAIGSTMSQLASLSPSSQGASLLQQDSASYSPGSSSSSNSIGELFNSADTSDSDSSTSILSAIA